MALKMAPLSVDYPHALPKSSYPLPYTHQFGSYLPSIPSGLPITLPPLAINWPSQCSLSPPWESLPLPRHGHLPSPPPSHGSRSLSPQSVARWTDDGKRSTPQRRPPSSSSTSVSWLSPRQYTLTPPPSLADTSSAFDCSHSMFLPRAGGLQYPEQSPYMPYHAGTSVTSLAQPLPHPLPRPTSAPYPFPPNRMGFPSIFVPAAASSHHFLCQPPYHSCQMPRGSSYPCETTKWLDLLAQLRRLPREVLRRISGYVDYERLICLYQLNKFMRDNIDIQQAPYDSKVAFVAFAEARFPKHWPKQKRKNPKSAQETQGPAGLGNPRGDAEGGGTGRGEGPNKRQRSSKCDTPENPDGEKDVESIHNPGNFGCYLDCFKILDAENFESFQWTTRDVQTTPSSEKPRSSTLSEPLTNRLPFPRSSPTGRCTPTRPATRPTTPAPARRPSRQNTPQPRRYCIKCGVKHGYYKPGEYILRRAGDRVWVCTCLRIHEYGTITCGGCGSYCPFSPSDR